MLVSSVANGEGNQLSRIRLPSLGAGVQSTTMAMMAARAKDGRLDNSGGATGGAGKSQPPTEAAIIDQASRFGRLRMTSMALRADQTASAMTGSGAGRRQYCRVTGRHRRSLLFVSVSGRKEPMIRASKRPGGISDQTPAAQPLNTGVAGGRECCSRQCRILPTTTGIGARSNGP